MRYPTGRIGWGQEAHLERYTGYYRPYSTSHRELDGDEALQEEVRDIARAVTATVRDLLDDNLSRPDSSLQNPRPK